LAESVKEELEDKEKALVDAEVEAKELRRGVYTHVHACV